jgi:signal transduction histidine kinase
MSPLGPLSDFTKGFNWHFFRQTPVRLTLVFLAVYVFVVLLISVYLFLVTRSESQAWSNAAVETRIMALERRFKTTDIEDFLASIKAEEMTEWAFAKGVIDAKGESLVRNLRAESVNSEFFESLHNRAQKTLLYDGQSISFSHFSPARGKEQTCCRYLVQVKRFNSDVYVYVAMDMEWVDNGYDQVSNALWAGGIVVIFFGLLAGYFINNEVTRSVLRFSHVFDEVEKGNLSARVMARTSGDEFDALALRINQALERMETSMNNLKYAGDALAHDLRHPLTRLRSRLELASKQAILSPLEAKEALILATDEADQVLRTFQTVFSISRLQTQGKAPDQKLFSASDLAKDMSEWFEAVAWEKEIVFDTEITPSVMLMGNRDFLAQALSNILDNAFKYTPKGAGVTFRLRRNRAYEIEFSVTDTGPGVPLEDRERIVERFVRLEKSRNMPGVGLGLSMVQAVAQAHGGRLSIDEGPGVFENKGPGLRVAFILPDQSAN